MAKKKIKILIIDDSEDILFLVKSIFLADCEPVTFKSAKKALEVIDLSFDAIILDLMMPEMNGLEFLQIIRKKKSFNNIPVIILTAKSNVEEEISNFFEMGANDYVSKPFLNEELRARVKTHANLKIKSEQLRLSNKQLNSRNIELQKAIKEEELLNEKIIEKNIQLKLAFSRIEELNKALEHSATHDALMEIYNRGAILSYLENDIKRVKRLKSHLSLMMFDIDFFKKINDTYGHLAGDFILKELSHVVQKGIRDIDLFGRYGGEEFLIILPDTRLSAGIVMAERLLEKIRDHIFEYGKLKLSITVSIGIVEYKKDENIDKFIERVDKALYEAKAYGRNCFKSR